MAPIRLGDMGFEPPTSKKGVHVNYRSCWQMTAVSLRPSIDRELQLGTWRERNGVLFYLPHLSSNVKCRDPVFLDRTVP